MVPTENGGFLVWRKFATRIPFTTPSALSRAKAPSSSEVDPKGSTSEYCESLHHETIGLTGDFILLITVTTYWDYYHEIFWFKGGHI